MPPVEQVAAMIALAVASSIAPGPNNVMLTASGATYGFARTVPHMAGAIVGFAGLMLAAGAGVSAVTAAWPQARTALGYAGALYLIWLAWRIGHAPPPAARAETGPGPLTVSQAALLRAANPKALATAAAIMSVLIRPASAVFDVVFVSALFAVASIPSAAVWTGFGHVLRNLLRDPLKARAFNISMAMLLLLSLLSLMQRHAGSLS